MAISVESGVSSAPLVLQGLGCDGGSELLGQREGTRIITPMRQCGQGSLCFVGTHSVQGTEYHIHHCRSERDEPVGHFGSSWWRLQAGGAPERHGGPPCPRPPGIKLTHPQCPVPANEVPRRK